MKTLFLSIILAFSSVLINVNCFAGGIDSSNTFETVSKSGSMKIYNFSFKLDPSFIEKAAEIVDTAELNFSTPMQHPTKVVNIVPFAFKLDVGKICREAQQIDLTELENIGS